MHLYDFNRYQFSLSFQSCSNRGAYNNIPLDNEALVNPASRVEKLWLARTQYDSDRRLIIPKVGGQDGEQSKNILQMAICIS